jgi:hypothetical protein
MHIIFLFKIKLCIFLIIDNLLAILYCSQLKSKAPNHSLVTSLATFHGAFDRVAGTLA